MLCPICNELIISAPFVGYVTHENSKVVHYHVQCFIESRLAPGQLSDAVSATWGGQAGVYANK